MSEPYQDLESGYWLDLWRTPNGDQVLLPTTNHQLYARQPGWTLLGYRAYDRRLQMAADGAANKWHGFGTSAATAIFPAGPLEPLSLEAPSLVPLASPEAAPLQTAASTDAAPLQPFIED